MRTYQPPEDLAPLRQRLADDDAYTWDLKLDPVQPEPEAVLVVIESEVRPEVHSPAVGRVSFTPGSLAGLSFLYAPEPGHFICGGAVTVRNSKNVDIEVSHFGESPSQQQSQAEYETRVALERDLELHLRFATTKALHALQSP